MCCQVLKGRSLKGVYIKIYATTHFNTPIIVCKVYLYHWPLKDTISYNRRRIRIRNSQTKLIYLSGAWVIKSLYLAGAIIL